jgi:uncharacterized phage protein (TIGR02218 family)
MTVSASMITALQSNVTFLVPIWTMLASDGTRASYCAHTRNLTFNSLTYTAAPVEPSRFSQTIGLDANHVELFGVLDDVVTEQDIQGGKWKNAKVVFEHIAYDPATGAASATVTGSVGKMKGQTGKFSINNGTFRVEFRSLSDLLGQEIGELTSPIARNRQLSDLVSNVAPYTFARTVTAFTDRRNFTVNGTAQINDYFKYGKVTFTSGANNGRSMEIKASVGNVIELQLPMLSDIAIGNTVSLLAGFDGSREQARDKFGAMEAFNAEPDLPGLQSVLKYPE